MSNTFIYALRDPRDGMIRYVGRTTQLPKKRLRGHLYKRRATSNTHRDRWIASLNSHGLIPLITCLAVDEGNGYEAERWWIQKLKYLGMALTNAHGGGQGGKPGVKQSKPKVITQEQREKIRASLKGRKVGFSIHPWVRTEEKERRRVEAVRKATAGRSHTEEEKRRIRESNIKTYREHPHSDEHRKKISEGVYARLSQWSPEERKQKLGRNKC